MEKSYQGAKKKIFPESDIWESPTVEGCKESHLFYYRLGEMVYKELEVCFPSLIELRSAGNNQRLS